MKIETNPREVDWEQLGPASAFAERIGFDGITQSEVHRDPFVSLTAIAMHTNKVELTPSVAIVFPRSPMIVAYSSRNIHDLSKGRFTVGLGTQVKGHIQRRFSTEWTGKPGPQMREYILALHAIWDTFEKGDKLNFQGDFYNFNLLTPEFNIGPTPYGRVKVHLAAVNKYLIQTAGELADGLRVHSFATPEYVRDVIWPNVQIGAKKSGRSLENFELVGAGFIATGPDEEALVAAREHVRYRIAWYASTRTYLPVLEHHGWQDINPDLRTLISEERWDELPSLISDEMLDTFCTSGTYDTFVDAARNRIEGLTDRISLPLPEDAEAHEEKLRDTIARIKELSPATEYRQSPATTA